MSIKGKFLSIISIFALAIMLTLVGIWAVTDLDFIVGGDITYTAPAKYDLNIIITSSLQGSVYFSINQEEFKPINSIGTYVGMSKFLIEDVSTIILQNNSTFNCTISSNVECPITSLEPNSTSPLIKLTQNGTVISISHV